MTKEISCPKCNKNIPGASVYCLYCGSKTKVPKQRQRSHANGIGSVYQRGKTWTASYTYGWRTEDEKIYPLKRTKGGFKRKIDAFNYLPILRDPVPKKAEITVKEQYEQFQGSHKYKNLSKNKQTTYDKAFERLSPLHSENIGNLKPYHLQNIVDTIETYYPARDVRQVLSHLFKEAVMNGHAEKDYSKFVSLPPVPDSKIIAFTDDEVRKLWNDYHHGNIFTGYILLMIYTGTGTGELMNIKRSLIDFDNQLIYNVGTKNKKRREVPVFLANIIIPVLKVLYENSTSSLKLLNMNKDNFYAEYYITLERAGCRRLTPYSCRHTTGTALAKAGVQPAIIKEIMRHGNYKTTIGYTHIDAAPQIKALNTLNLYKPDSENDVVDTLSIDEI